MGDRPPIVMPDWLDAVEPTEAGPFGRAWLGRYCDVEDLREDGAPADAQIASWIMHVPGSHPFWTWYAMECVTLRPIDGMPPAVLRFPGAAYELLVISLNPEHPAPHPHRLGAEGNPVHHLMPPDQVLQFPALKGGDDQAREITGLFAKAVVNGVLVPDQDHRERWRQTMAKTIEHFTTGHPEFN